MIYRHFDHSKPHFTKILRDWKKIERDCKKIEVILPSILLRYGGKSFTALGWFVWLDRSSRATSDHWVGRWVQLCSISNPLKIPPVRPVPPALSAPEKSPQLVLYPSNVVSPSLPSVPGLPPDLRTFHVLQSQVTLFGAKKEMIWLNELSDS